MRVFATVDIMHVWSRTSLRVPPVYMPAGLEAPLVSENPGKETLHVFLLTCTAFLRDAVDLKPLGFGTVFWSKEGLGELIFKLF